MQPRYFLPILLFLLSFDQPKLVKTKVNEEITIYVPKGWQPMDQMDFTQRYPSIRAPLAAYTNSERNIDLSVNISATQWPDANLEIAQRFFKASLMNMFDRVEMINEGIREVKGKRFIFFEFESRVNGNNQGEGLSDPVLKYSYVQYLVEPRRTLVFSFNAPRRVRQEWQQIAEEMMKSVVVK